MGSFALQKQTKDLLWGLGAVLLGLCLLAIAVTYLKIDNVFILVTILLLPVIVTLAVLRYLGEVTLGDIFSAKLNQQVLPTKPEELSGDIAKSVARDIELITKQGSEVLPEVRKRIARMQIEKPVMLLLYMGTSYTVADIEHYIQDLAHLRSFKFVVILSEGDRIVGYIPYYSLQHILGFEVRANALLQFIQQKDEESVRSYPGVRSTKLVMSDTNRLALQTMLNERLEAVIVEDPQGTIAGIVERDELIPRILLS